MVRTVISFASKNIVLLICLVLFTLPFFWLSPGELELGGDSSRLYLYDPASYLKAYSLYSSEVEGVGKVVPNQYILPFLLLLQLLYFIFHSPYILICLLNSLKLVGAFLFIYLIVVEILQKHDKKNQSPIFRIAGILAGIFYTLSPSVGANMSFALLTHNQVFLNPMVFYLMMRFLVSQKGKYLWLTLFVTILFSPNFSLVAPPPPFAFYPLAFLFLVLYVTVCLQKPLPLKGLLFGIVLFFGLHAFHIIPAILTIFDPGSYYNARIVDAYSGQNEALNYFNAILGLGKVSGNIFYSYALETKWTTFLVPFVVVLGLLLNKNKQKELLLLSIFFFFTLFLVSANITHVGIEMYRKLFYIPGFGMFRFFIGHWQWVYAFFYSLLFGISLSVVFSRLAKRQVYLAACIIGIFFIFSSWTFISGKLLHGVHWGSNNIKTIITMDPRYEETLSFIRTLSDDGKFLNLPLTDWSYQVVGGTNNGAYIGTSMISYLTGRKDFSGYSNFAPFSDIFLKLAKERDYKAIQRLLGLLNIKYVFHNSDPKVYEDSFPTFPYSFVRKSLPDTQKGLTDFVSNITDEKIYTQGPYTIYYTDKNNYLPHFYIPIRVIPHEDKNLSFFVDNVESDIRTGYLQKSSCTKFFTQDECSKRIITFGQETPHISYQKINPTKYKIHITAPKEPFFLIFSDQFNNGWKLYVTKKTEGIQKVQQSYFNGSISEYEHTDSFLDNQTFETRNMTPLHEKQHFSINGYANAWYIKPSDLLPGGQYEIIIELAQQGVFYYSLVISLVSLLIFLFYGIMLLKR